MIDRGEKIVRLAHELLETTPDIKAAETSPNEHAPITLKTLCLAALLAAFGSCGLTHLFDEARRPINRYERVELDALLYYATHVQAADESRLRQELRHKLAVVSFDNLNVFDYRRTRDYLRDIIR
jgi:hypothetical protein